MKSDNNICTRCKCDQLKNPVSKNNPCPLCGYPLQLSKMLERLRNNKDSITEVMTWNTFGFDPKTINLEDALKTLEEYEHMTFPLKDAEDMIMISIENDLFVINFGPPGAWEKYFQTKERNK